MHVNSKITINKIRIKQLTHAQTQALEMTGEALHTDVLQAQVIPFKSGNLQNESTFVDYTESNKCKVTLVSSTPYARRLYYHPEYNFSTEENPNAKGKWYQDWIDGNKKDFCKKAFKAFYKRIGGV
ncbi:hypothetical protein SAMN02745248_02406 [Hathewaya proteolytica DSM 3090]|uniref:Minor capsid protein n=1 Tax=Hathewaya proteolytica DSM 3090 TaxID=1121331 RepID=A0A1M6S088_9CLOT|nr:hypothetical protein [Hathewaya proteolytica]SHK38008.1 hypothetical protein SAMN02745248_02406 [Hathewaya proteolytica DSM 3090]